jgi:uncharacterized membrane protein
LLDSAAVVTKNGEGKVHVNETHEVTTKKGATRGAIGGAWGKPRDTGIKTGDMKKIAENL